MYAVYGLVDPRTALIRYVGVTCVPLRTRLARHLNDRRRTHRRYWIEQLLERELRPYIVLIEDGLASKIDGGAAETRWIEYGRANGWPLTNTAPGGIGGSTGPEAYAKAWTTRRANGRDKTSSTPESRARQSASMKRWYADIKAGRRPYPAEKMA